MALFSFTESLNPVGYLAAFVPSGDSTGAFGFHIFEAILQAFIFTILPIVYLGLAVAEEH